jgi:CheY-like chemotaxis protein
VALAILNRLGYRADTASNGVEAVQACERQQYDVVLMDIQMPQMDGIEATQQIRTYQKHYHRPHIIALTAHVHDEQRRQFLNAGMDDYIRKPIQVTDLTKALKTFARRKHKAQIPAE